MDEIKIYVATHQRTDNLLKIPYPYYVPIHCGKEIYSKMEEELGWPKEGFLPELGDNTGENISAKNPNYCELTAMYWIWKNDITSDIVGLNHYRRYFSEDDDNLKFLSKESIFSKLEDCDCIINGCSTSDDYTTNEEESVYNQYKDCHVIHDLDIALEGIEKLFPDLSEGINKELRQSGAMCLCNMLITRKSLFNRYCEFLFPTLKYVESNINLDDHDDYNKRVFGFLGERLLRPFLKASGYKSRSASCLNWEKYCELN